MPNIDGADSRSLLFEVVNWTCSFIPVVIVNHAHPLEHWYHLALVFAFEMLLDQVILTLKLRLCSLSHRKQWNPITHRVLLELVKSQVVIQRVLEFLRHVFVRFYQGVHELYMINQLVKRVLLVRFINLLHSFNYLLFVWTFNNFVKFHFLVWFVHFFECLFVQKYGRNHILVELFIDSILHLIVVFVCKAFFGVQLVVHLLVLQLVDEPLEEFFELFEGESLKVDFSFGQAFIIAVRDKRQLIRLHHECIQFNKEEVPLWFIHILLYLITWIVPFKRFKH